MTKTTPTQPPSQPSPEENPGNNIHFYDGPHTDEFGETSHKELPPDASPPGWTADFTEMVKARQKQATEKTEQPRTADAYRESVKGAMFRSLTHADRQAVAGYPEEVRDVIRRICELWNLSLPAQKGRTKLDSYWLKSARDFKEACGEYNPLMIINLIHYDFEQKLNETGLFPFTVSTPKSLVNCARSKVAELRTKEKKEAEVKSVPHTLTLDEVREKARQAGQDRFKFGPTSWYSTDTGERIQI